jgi:hypothetical protein
MKDLDFEQQNVVDQAVEPNKVERRLESLPDFPPAPVFKTYPCGDSTIKCSGNNLDSHASIIILSQLTSTFFFFVIVQIVAIDPLLMTFALRHQSIPLQLQIGFCANF